MILVVRKVTLTTSEKLPLTYLKTHVGKSLLLSLSPKLQTTVTCVYGNTSTYLITLSSNIKPIKKNRKLTIYLKI